MRAIDADRIVYSWQTDADGQEHDGVTLKSIIDKMPTIVPERKKGKWTVKEGKMLALDECGICRKIVFHREPHYNFCPHCGADMREDDA